MFSFPILITNHIDSICRESDKILRQRLDLVLNNTISLIAFQSLQPYVDLIEKEFDEKIQYFMDQDREIQEYLNNEKCPSVARDLLIYQSKKIMRTFIVLTCNEYEHKISSLHHSTVVGTLYTHLHKLVLKMIGD